MRWDEICKLYNIGLSDESKNNERQAAANNLMQLIVWNKDYNIVLVSCKF